VFPAVVTPGTLEAVGAVMAITAVMAMVAVCAVTVSMMRHRYPRMSQTTVLDISINITGARGTVQAIDFEKPVR
jgi:hypothetical protein